jgi:hypothetical protein
MYNKMTSRRAIKILISLLLIVVVTLGGCTTNTTHTTDTEYLKANATKLGISFSFEYPASYTKLTPDAFEDTGGEPSVSLLYSEPGSTQEKADIQIHVILLSPIAGRPDAAAWTEEHIKLLENNDKGYELIERSAIQVAGINGNMAAYNSSILGKYLNSSNLICRDAYIDYKGYIWKISVLAVEEIGDQAKPDFDHLIESFKFLD